jgi:nitrilase
MRKPEGREAFARYHAAAIDLDGPEVPAGRGHRRNRGFAVVGVIERDGGTLYCTVLYFDGAKGLVGKHRKLMPTAGERLIWGFGDGSTMPVFKTDFGTIGAVICWENYMPALRMHMYHQGVTFTARPRRMTATPGLPTMQHIALEGRCFVLTACQHGSPARLWPGSRKRPWRCARHGDDARRVGHRLALGPGAGGAGFQRRDDPLRHARPGRGRAREV